MKRQKIPDIEKQALGESLHSLAGIFKSSNLFYIAFYYTTEYRSV